MTMAGTVPYVRRLKFEPGVMYISLSPYLSLKKRRDIISLRETRSPSSRSPGPHG